MHETQIKIEKIRQALKDFVRQQKDEKQSPQKNYITQRNEI